MLNGVVVRALACTQVINNTVSGINLVVDGDLVVTRGFMSSCNRFIFFFPPEPTGVLIS